MSGSPARESASSSVFLAVSRLAHDHDVIGRLEELDEAVARHRMVLRDAHLITLPGLICPTTSCHSVLTVSHHGAGRVYPSVAGFDMADGLPQSVGAAPTLRHKASRLPQADGEAMR
jgi:hypothetical protein